MIPRADVDPARRGLLLEMTLQAQRRVALTQHLGVHRAVRLMASRAALAHRFVLEDERSALRGVATAARIKLRRVRRTAAHDGRAFVRIVAVTAGDLAFHHRMMAGQAEPRLHLQMTAEAGLRRFVWVHDRVMRTAGVVVQTAGPVARFASDIFHIRSLHLQAGVGRGFEIPHNLRVAIRAALRADEVSPRNIRRRHRRSRHRRRAGGKRHRDDRDGKQSPRCFPMRPDPVPGFGQCGSEDGRFHGSGVEGSAGQCGKVEGRSTRWAAVPTGDAEKSSPLRAILRPSVLSLLALFAITVLVAIQNSDGNRRMHESNGRRRSPLIYQNWHFRYGTISIPDIRARRGIMEWMGGIGSDSATQRAAGRSNGQRLVTRDQMKNEINPSTTTPPA